MTNPIIGFIRTCLLFISGKVIFDRSVVNKKILMEDREFTIFRRVKIKAKTSCEPEAFFLVRFKPLDMTPEENIRFSKLPMMIFMGFRGFRSKYWAVDFETGLCQGLYEWQTVQDAKNYAASIAMRFMTKRSDPKSVEYKIVDKRKEALTYSIK